MNIGDIATNENCSVFLTAEVMPKVYAWDIDKLCKVAELNTIMDYGGQRLVISNDGKLCIAAAYERFGICAYEINTGDIVWQRKDIKTTQKLRLRPNNNELYVCREYGATLILDCLSGETITPVRNVGNIWFNTFGEDIIANTHENIVSWGKHKIESPTFCFLDTCATPNGITLSAVNDGLYFYDNDGRLVWEIRPNSGNGHCLKLAFLEKYNIVLAVLWKDTGEQPYYILYGINAVNGDIVFEFGLPLMASEFSFLCQQEKLICSSGEIFKLSDNEPQLLYNFNWETEQN